MTSCFGCTLEDPRSEPFSKEFLAVYNTSDKSTCTQSIAAEKLPLPVTILASPPPCAHACMQAPLCCTLCMHRHSCREDGDVERRAQIVLWRQICTSCSHQARMWELGGGPRSGPWRRGASSTSPRCGLVGPGRVTGRGGSKMD